MRKFGSLKVSPMVGKSLKSGSAQGVFATQGSEIYTPGMCEMISDLVHEYTRLKLRQQGSSDQQPIRQMVHQMELRIDAQDANTSLANTSLVEDEDIEGTIR
jgi:hypothetical protein